MSGPVIGYLHRKLNRPLCARCRRAVAWGLEPIPKIALVVVLVMFGGAMIFGVASIGNESAHTRMLVMRFAQLEQRQTASADASLAERRAANQAALTQIRRTSTANHRQALRSAALARRLALVAKQRATDAARSAAQVAVLGQQNRRAIAELSTTQAQLNVLTANLARVTSRQVHTICVNVRSQLHGTITSLAGPHPQALALAVLHHIDASKCP